MTEGFDLRLMSRHATREARRERIPIEMIRRCYEEPDDTRPSTHDELRKIRTRWFGNEGVEVVVDIDDGRIISVWRRGSKR